MKKIFFSFFIAAVLFAVTYSVQAALIPGTLVKCAESPDIYQVSTRYENRLELIKNEVVFVASGFQWNDIVSVSCDDIENASLSFIGFPTEKLLKFEGSPEVYENRLNCESASSSTAQGCGDVFYHIPNEATAELLFGSAWESKIVEVSASFKTYFTPSGEGYIFP